MQNPFLPMFIVLILLPIILAGCGPVPAAQAGTPPAVESYSDVDDVETWRDPQTGCQYLLFADGNLEAGGMTPRLDANGLPICR
ncbi:DUF6440 family protein [Phenylobacterium sp.]|uniref:DUF6440 family protein n=1 Tax=Phenylobacterium sp. TaxID=1871053 RepID=UPI00393955E1